ncbi:MAG: 3-hydroxyacyl-CoA dehydrogenase/enoyl-CoA hydratase family protein [Pseudarcicella sp.]|nr:3-hydroxyacyl-CoA dehydrogenase/enoyl-CoA hydratase family protein [Pseudarcicella sp.]
MNRSIKKVAVLGSGIMGSRIACHFANIGVDVLLLDIIPKEPNEIETKKGQTLEHPAVRNRIVNEAFQNTLKANPAALYAPNFANRVKLGNMEDNLKEIKDYDWVIEVIVENLVIKQALYQKIDALRKPGTLVSSNTSGIPIHLMADGRSEDFKAHFCGTHFFNPPRYLKLLEIIPTKETSKEVLDFLMHYGDRFLGKTTVLCKDTPAFIANRIGIYSMMRAIKTALELDLTVEEVDKLTSVVVGRPKSGTFRLSDVVGLDIAINVSNNLYAGLPNDESKDTFLLPPAMKQMQDNKWLGDKTGQGFYKKIKNEAGKSEILALNLKTFEYQASAKPKFAVFEQTKTLALKDRFTVLLADKSKAGDFYRKTILEDFQYVSHRVPEIADEPYKIDAAICAGFGWEMGIFATWDAIGVAKGIELMQSQNLKAAAWVQEMLDKGCTSFYKTEKGKKLYYDPKTKAYQNIPGTESFLILENLSDNIVWKNDESTAYDLGDGILGLEFRSKMNTFGSNVLQGVQKSIALAEKDFRGLVIGNDSNEAFSAGANLAMLFMFAVEQEFDEVNMMIAQFQQTMMRVRYSSIPVVVAPHTLALGGGCEINLHADRVVAAAETYMGLVEVGVGLIPAGGGTKEMALRCSDRNQSGDTELNTLQNAFMNIAMAKVSTSAHEAQAMNYLQKGDQITVNRARLLSDAKQAAIEIAEAGYTQAKQRTDIKVQGKAGIALFKAGIEGMKMSRYISEHDAKIADKLAYVLSGGDLSYAQTVTEQYLLDLEREAFLSLSGEKKTLERIQSLLNGGKPLRN